MKLNTFVLVGALALLAGGCAHEFVYVPVGAGATGEPAARYPVPPNNPQGEVYVTSFGFTDMQAGSQQGPLLHVRLAVSNGSMVPWSLDAWQQRLSVPGVGLRPPAFLNTDAGGNGPTYQIPPGRANAFDLYFSIPPSMNRADTLGGFSLNWNVNAAGMSVAQATSFQRVVDENPDAYEGYPPYVTVGLGFGVDWWGGSLYPYGGFSPTVRHYYYPPYRTHGGAWYGPRQAGWRAGPVGGWAHGGPHGGFHGGGFHGGGFHGGGFHDGGFHGGGAPGGGAHGGGAHGGGAPGGGAHGGGAHGGGGHR
jgi:hypothetical protein